MPKKIKMTSRFPTKTNRFYKSKSNKFLFAALLPLFALALFFDDTSSLLQFNARNNKTSSSAKINLNVDGISKAEKESLPTSSDIENLYGPQTVIDGLDSCKSYRDTVDEKERWIAPAGLYNTVSHT